MMEEDSKSPRCAVCGLQSAANAALLPLPGPTIDAKLYRAWVDFVRGCPGNGHWEPDSHTAFVCTLHFTSNRLRRCKNRWSARAGAVPTLYPSQEQLRRIAEASSVVVAATTQGLTKAIAVADASCQCPLEDSRVNVAVQCRPAAAHKSVGCFFRTGSKSASTQIIQTVHRSSCMPGDQSGRRTSAQNNPLKDRQGNVAVQCGPTVAHKSVGCFFVAGSKSRSVQTTRTVRRPRCMPASKPSISPSTAEGDNSHQGLRRRCHLCNYETDKGYLLAAHAKVHTGKHPFKCDYCPRRFPERSKLRIHLRTHRGERPFQCPLCPQSYSYKPSLQRHLNIHAGGKPLQCPSCPQSFTSKSKLKEHLDDHLRQKPFQCPSCPRSFANTSSLNEHMGSHPGDGRFDCPLCPQSFLERPKLKEHMCTHTVLAEGERSQPGRRLRCCLCDYETLWTSSLVVHSKVVHAGFRPFKCPSCPKRFTFQFVLKKHMNVHAAKQPFQ